MLLRSSSIAALALVLGLATPLAAQQAQTGQEQTGQDQTGDAQAGAQEHKVKPGADMVVATVNGQDITIGDLIVMRDALPDQYKELPDEVLFPALINQAVNQTLLAQTVKEITPEIKLRLANEERSLKAGTAITRIVGEAVTDEALQKAYEEKYANAEPETEYNASHILVETKEKAEDLIRQLKEGADFATLAKENSTGPSGPNGGELGWFSKGMMVKPFEDAVIGMKPGTFSETPVQTQFGWHVIRLNETRLKSAPKLDDVRSDLISEIQKKAVEKALKELEDKASIERADTANIDPTVLRDQSLISK